MKLTTSITTNINTKAVRDAVEKAGRLGMRDTIVAIHGDTVRPPSPVKTGNNRRSMTSEVSGMGGVASGYNISPQGGGSAPDRIVDDTKIQGAVYSTSGYGGFLETGTSKMPAQPYIRPALDRHNGELAPNIRKHMS